MRQAVRKCGDGHGSWVKVAKLVGGGVNNVQCNYRWCKHVNPAQSNCKPKAHTDGKLQPSAKCKMRAWTEKEVECEMYCQWRLIKILELICDCADI